MEIDLGEIRKDVQCPICLGIIKKTRTVMECLHRFCRECIDKSMRLGNNECPACRKHCASRRSLRDDPKFDALIAALFTNIDSYEEEELAFHEDEMARNKQIQASIAQISQRQSEALVKRRSLGKEAAVLMRSPRIASGSRRRRNSRNMEQQNASEAHEDDDNDDNNNRGRDKDSSSDERGTEVRQKKRRKRSTSRSTQHPSSSGANKNNGNCADNDTEVYRDTKGISPGLVWNPEILAWGRGGTRSNTRHGNNTSGGSSKSVRNARVNKLVEYLRSSVDGSSVELDIHVKLVSLDTKCIPDLPQPYLCCRPTLLVKQLREFVALQIHLKTEEVELLVTRRRVGEDAAIENLPAVTPASAAASKDEMLSLEDNETLSRLKIDFISSHEQHLIIAYRKKQTE
ncbi:RING 1A [Arabidopsis thaliana]|nr:RING 1A [Arabidopsis thaliana]ANM69943.1 RING 1A [Arabidopsis thaliana]|eukprot:NP_001331587.1 RING 1A [Arabidopsis thaliana]